MAFSKVRRQEIIDALLKEVGSNLYYGNFSVETFAKAHEISRQSVYNYLALLEQELKIKKLKGKNNYRLIDTTYKFQYLIKGLEESVVWSRDIDPLLHNVPDTALRNLAYAFCEMLNNAIEHSEGTKVEIRISINAFSVSFQIIDNGIGIFAKIASAMQFAEKRYAILELAKGKFTTDPGSHSGEGIFFSSKLSDVFGIFSDDLVFSAINYREGESERLFDYKHSQPSGTTVFFSIFCDHDVTMAKLVKRYTKAPDYYGFEKTVVPVRLLEYGEKRPMFISRSQARRLLIRFERFTRIELDFTGVDEIGQGFADEIFRVFPSRHFESEITAINCNEDVEQMIKHVTRR